MSKGAFSKLLSAGAWGGLAILGGISSYLLALTAAAVRAQQRRTTPSGQQQRRFAILIPAHNEEQLLPDLLTSLNQQEYPREHFDLHVVADNCHDQTALVARTHGAVAHERFNRELIGKGHALQWLIDRLIDQDRYEAYIVLDADSIVSPNFLRVMDGYLTQGARVVQGYYAVRDPGRSWSVSLRYAALAALHYLRPLGRTSIGGSAGLKGNGMLFTPDILRRLRWSGGLTEDIEFHIAIIQSGERVVFAPEAVIEAEMPDTLAGSNTQNERWEQGRLAMARSAALPLIRQGVQQRQFAPIDAAAELLIPPFSTLAGASVVAAAAGIVLPGQRRARGLVGGAILAAQAIYLLASLILARAPRSVYLSLLYAPFFVLWKLRLYARVLTGRKQQEWVRTERNATTSKQ